MARGTKIHIFERLYDAALTEDLTTFQQLLQQHPHLLDRVSYAYCPSTTPLLHMATLQGNLGVVKEVLKINPKLAQQLDCQKSSPLHIAAAQGHRQIAYRLLSAAPKMCWRRDCHGMNPIHIAAMNGHVEILEALIGVDPIPAREKVDGGQTVLHLCVKHGQRKALELLVQILGDHLVSAEDHEGYTILHLAVRCYKTEMIRYLVNNKKIERTKENSKGKTAADILREIPPNETTSEIKEILSSWSLKASSHAFNKFREIGMVIAVLIAAIAFQAIVSPPGGVWQDDSSTHRAGAAVMAYTHPKIYKHFIRANTVAFASSLVIIFLLTTKLSSIHVLLTLAVMHTMWVSLASMAVSYGASVMVITPNTQTQSLAYVIGTVVAVTVSIIGLFWLQKYTIRGRHGRIIINDIFEEALPENESVLESDDMLESAMLESAENESVVELTPQ